MSDISHLEYLLDKRTEELLKAESKLSDTEYDLRFAKKELDEYKRRDNRAYDIYVTSEEPCCDHESRSEELEAVLEEIRDAPTSPWTNGYVLLLQTKAKAALEGGDG